MFAMFATGTVNPTTGLPVTHLFSPAAHGKVHKGARRLPQSGRAPQPLQHPGGSDGPKLQPSDALGFGSEFGKLVGPADRERPASPRSHLQHPHLGLQQEK